MWVSQNIKKTGFLTYITHKKPRQLSKWKHVLLYEKNKVSPLHLLLPKHNLFKNICDFTTASDWDCVAAVERLPVLHYSVDFIFLSFGIMGLICEL